MVALQEVLEDLRQQEQELAELMMQRLIPKAAYEEERKSVKMQITDISERYLNAGQNVCPKASMCRLQIQRRKSKTISIEGRRDNVHGDLRVLTGENNAQLR